jgi:fructoselysine-6-P-deglycase FrlB-like protein
MTEDLSWHGPEFPELRAGPPWVMEDMILAEAGLAEILAAAAADDIGDGIRSALDRGEPVAVVGCGTSEHGAMAVAAQLRAAAPPGRGWLIAARQAFEAALDPWPGFCLAVSHDGGTPATLAAVRRAGEAGAVTAAITAAPEAAVAEAAGRALVTPIADRSWCHTVGYLSPVVAGAALARRVAALPALGPTETRALLVAALGVRDQAAAAADRLAAVNRILVAGSGADWPAARELALKIEEGARLPAVGHSLETVLHGHLAACDSGTGLVVLVADPDDLATRQARAAQVAAAAREIGMPTVAIASAGVRLPASTSAVRLPDVPAEVPAVLGALVTTGLALQWLTLELAHRANTNPDLIRREQAAYRAAAAIGDASW